VRPELHAMGAAVAIFGLLLDAVSAIQTFVTVFISVYGILIFAYVLASWFPRLPYSLQPVLRFLYDVCDPYLRLFRRFVPAIGAIDFSPFIAVLSLYALDRIVNDVILDRLH